MQKGPHPALRATFSREREKGFRSPDCPDLKGRFDARPAAVNERDAAQALRPTLLACAKLFSL
jgi:hypothetical protein